MKQISIPNSRPNNWESAACIRDFTNPWMEETPPDTEFKIFRDEQNLYFRFLASCPDKPLVYVKNNDKMEVSHGERVEIFFRSDEAMNPYYGIEMDPLGRIMEYRTTYYRQFEFDWIWPEPLGIEAQISEGYYTVSGKISFQVLKDLKVFNEGRIQAGVYRGYSVDINDKSSIRWITWIDPHTPKADFHVPSSFGLFLLKD